MPSDCSGWHEERVGEPPCEGEGTLGAQRQRRAGPSARTHRGTEDDDDGVRRRDQQVTSLPVATEVTNASNAAMVSSISAVVIG